MRKGFLSSLGILVTSAGLAVAQTGPTALSNPGPNLQGAGSVPNVTPALVSGQPATQSAKSHDSCPPSELPPAPFDPGWGVWIPNGPNAFSPPEPKAPSPFDLCGPDQYWLRGDFLLWWIRRQPVPGPLVATGTPETGAVLGANGTSVLLGDHSLDYGPLVGGRFFAGVCTPDHFWALEAGALVLETAATNFLAASDAAGNPVLSRPVIDTLSNSEIAVPVSFPGAFAGSISVHSRSDLTSAEGNLWHYLNTGCTGPTIGLLVGFRYMFLQESIVILQQTELLAGGVAAFEGTPVVAPSTLGIADNFETRNDFYGGQVGFQVDCHPGRFFANFTGKLGLGNTHEVARNFGTSSLTNATGATTTVAGGLLTVGGNSGFHSQNEFTFLPEIALNVGMEVTCNLRMFVGYTFLYWDNVMRPGSEFNRFVNTSLVPTSMNLGSAPGSSSPSSLGDHTQFWAQGLTVGAALRY
jgi:hypothetical protein